MSFIVWIVNFYVIIMLYISPVIALVCRCKMSKTRSTICSKEYNLGRYFVVLITHPLFYLELGTFVKGFFPFFMLWLMFDIFLQEMTKQEINWLNARKFVLWYLSFVSFLAFIWFKSALSQWLTFFFFPQDGLLNCSWFRVVGEWLS